MIINILGLGYKRTLTTQKQVSFHLKKLKMKISVTFKEIVTN